MAKYRAHVTVSNGARMLGAKTIDSMVGSAVSTIGRPGTRHGAPGIWIEREGRDPWVRENFKSALRRLRNAVQAAGLFDFVYTTSAPADEAANDELLGLRVRRG